MMMRKEKIKVELLFVLLLLTRGIYAMDFKVDSIMVFSLDWDVLYCTSISCTDFFNYTNGDSCHVIKDKAEIDAIINLLDKLEKSNASRTKVDVRCKMFFFSSDTIVCTACTGNNGTLLDGVFYDESYELKNHLRNFWGQTKCNFKERKKKDYIEHGQNKLARKIKQIDRLKRKMKYVSNEPVLIKGYCTANTKGNIIKVTLMSKDSIITKRMIGELEVIFKKYVVWNANKERMSSDIIPIRIIID